jgi:hypothetical protein
LVQTGAGQAVAIGTACTKQWHTIFCLFYVVEDAIVPRRVSDFFLTRKWESAAQPKRYILPAVFLSKKLALGGVVWAANDLGKAALA